VAASGPDLTRGVTDLAVGDQRMRFEGRDTWMTGSDRTLGVCVRSARPAHSVAPCWAAVKAQWLYFVGAPI
jgi:hypothetical protein